jgi:transposase, IS5 family
MKQITPFPGGPEGHRKTLRAQFLIQMHQLVPWATLCALIEPYCREGLKKQPAVGLERMLRIVLLKQWFSLSDGAVEEALHDSVAMREFVGLDLNRDSVPDQNAIWRFRLVLEHGGLERQLFAAVSQHLKAAGLKLSIGTLVEANLISEPNWIQRKDLLRNPRRFPLAIELSSVPESHATPASVVTWPRSAPSGPPEPGAL